jgi:GGDEF domain-containing protein
LLPAQCAWLLLKRVQAELRPITRPAGYVLLGIATASLIRIAVDFALPLEEDLFRANAWDTLIIITYQMLGILLAFSLFLMVNRRLLVAVTTSIGVAGFDEATPSVDALLRAADAALYQAKREGRNRVVLHDSTVAS